MGNSVYTPSNTTLNPSTPIGGAGTVSNAQNLLTVKSNKSYSIQGMYTSGFYYGAVTGMISGFPGKYRHNPMYYLDSYIDCVKKDERPDFEKTYDIYIKNKKESEQEAQKLGEEIKPLSNEELQKKMFIDAQKLGFAMGRVRPENFD